MLRSAAIAAFILLICLHSPAQAPEPLAGSVDAVLDKSLASSGAPSLAVAVVRNSEFAYATAAGKASLSPNRAATKETRYAVGSISKQFTAAALLLLQEQGKVSLDDKVAKYFPGLTRANEVTIRELLSHTSGYEDYAPQDYMIPEWTKPIAPDTILDRWAKKPLNFDPGTRWQYSNTNYVLAAKIFEKASGQNLLEFLQSRIFDPLGMHSAGDCIADKSPNDAVAYTRYALGPPRPAMREGAGWYFGAGELCMTPADLARWDAAFLRRKILDARSYREFTTEVKLKNGDSTHYALGLQLGDFDGVPTISHSGEVSGFLAINTVFPSKNAAVIVLSNEDGINVIGSVSRQIDALLVNPGLKPASTAEIKQVRGILSGLQAGHVDRSLFTPDANFYFGKLALHDYRESLSKLGKLESVTRTRERLRGGMTQRVYDAKFQKKTVTLNTYVTNDGKYEQFLVEEQF
jgi:CubicO group peptidase (beta-lactamase class C family)